MAKRLTHDALKALLEKEAVPKKAKKLRTPGFIERAQLGALPAEARAKYIRKKGIDPMYDEGFQIGDIADVIPDIAAIGTEVAGGVAGGVLGGLPGAMAGAAAGGALGTGIESLMAPQDAQVDWGERAKESALWAGGGAGLLGVGTGRAAKGLLQKGLGKAISGPTGLIAGVDRPAQKRVFEGAKKYKDLIKKEADVITGEGADAGVSITRSKEFLDPVVEMSEKTRKSIVKTGKELSDEMAEHTIPTDRIVSADDLDFIKGDPDLRPIDQLTHRFLKGTPSPQEKAVRESIEGLHDAQRAAGKVSPQTKELTRMWGEYATEVGKKFPTQIKGDEAWTLYTKLAPYTNRPNTAAMANEIRSKIRDSMREMGGNIPENFEKYIADNRLLSAFKKINQGRPITRESVKLAKGQRVADISDEAADVIYKAHEKMPGPQQKEFMKVLKKAGLTPKSLRSKQNLKRDLDFLLEESKVRDPRVSPSLPFWLADMLTKYATPVYKFGRKMTHGRKTPLPGEGLRMIQPTTKGEKQLDSISALVKELTKRGTQVPFRE